MASQDDAELKTLTDQFVCVRVVQMGGVDLAIYQFDPFLSHAVMFLHADKTIYGRYGSAHPQAKRSKTDSNPNHTLAGLKAAISKALALHKSYTDDPDTWRPKLAGKTGAEPMWRYTEKTPAARTFKRLGRVKGEDTRGCVHCHEIAQAYIDSYFIKKRKVPDKLLWVYPSPSILGLTLSKDHCARVTAVAPGSIAAKAGVKSGDEIKSLDGQPLCSVADVQWVLHNYADEGGTLNASLERAGRRETVGMELDLIWRRAGDWAWRYRVAGYAMWLWGGVSLADAPEGVRVSHRSPGWFKKTNRDARKALKVGDVIQKVDGRDGWTRSTYLAYLMREKKPGSTVKLDVLRKGRPAQVSFRIPKPRPVIMGH